MYCRGPPYAATQCRFNMRIHEESRPLRCRPLIIWGGHGEDFCERIFFRRPSERYFFFSDTLRMLFFIFFGQNWSKNFFFYNMVSQGNCKKNFLGLNWRNIIFFSGDPLEWIFFSVKGPNDFFFAFFTMPPPQMINGQPLTVPQGHCFSTLFLTVIRCKCPVSWRFLYNHIASLWL